MEKFEQFKKNYVFFNGFLSADAEIRYFENGGCKCTFSLPLKKSKDDEPTWLNCECWSNKAEEIYEKYKKGSEIVVGGYFKESEFEGKKYLNFVVKIVG